MTGTKVKIFGHRSSVGWWWRWECPCCKAGDWLIPWYNDASGSKVRPASEIAMWAVKLHLIEAGHIRTGRS
jgi:hypothetical protein